MEYVRAKTKEWQWLFEQNKYIYLSVTEVGKMVGRTDLGQNVVSSLLDVRTLWRLLDTK